MCANYRWPFVPVFRWCSGDAAEGDQATAGALEEKMAGFVLAREDQHRRSAPAHCAANKLSHKFTLDATGLLMEGTESNRRRQPFQGCSLPKSNC